MPTKIKSNFKPSNRVYELFSHRYGISFERAREFIGHEIGEFFMYWENIGKAKSDWDTTCLNWMKRQYENKREQMARDRPPTKPQEDIFETVLNNINSKTVEVVLPQMSVRHSPIPGEGQTMTESEALEMLAKFRGKK